MRYRAFISYKHTASSGFAERLELAIKGYAKPLWQPPPPIFRDEKYLKPGLDLPRMITEALEQSEFLIYLASPDAARSTWVQDELSQWCSQPDRLKRLIIVLTEGDIAIDNRSKIVDWERTNAIPLTLRGVIEKVPFYLDCTKLISPERQTLLDPDFKQVVNRIVASFRNIDPIEMIGQEIAQHRKNIRNRNWLVGAAVFALLLGTGGGGIALRQSQAAAAQSRISKASQLASDAAAAANAQLPQRALLLGVAAAEVTRSAGEGITPQTEQTLRDLLAVFGGYGLSGHTGPIDKLFFLRNGTTLLSAGKDGQVLLWQHGGDGRALGVRELIAQRGRVLAIQILNQEGRIRFLTEKGHVLVRNLASGLSGESKLDLPEFNYEEACDTKITATQVLQMSSRDGVLRKWDLASKRESQPDRQKVATDALGGCMFSGDGQWLYIESEKQTPSMLRIAAPIGRISLDGTAGGVVAAAFNPQSSQIALTMEDGGLRLWDLETGRKKAWRSLQIAGEDNLCVGIAYARSGRVLAVADEKGTVELWRIDGVSPRSIGRAAVPFELYRGMEGQLTFERGDSLLIVSDGLRASAAIPLSNDAVPLGVQELHNHPSPDDVSGDRATPYALHPRRPLLVTAGNDNNAYLWSIEGTAFKRRTEPLRGHDEEILALTFSPDGRWLVTAGNDKTLRFWPVDPAQWAAAPAVLSYDPSDILLNPDVPNSNGGILGAHFLDGEEWFEGFFESYGATSAVRFGRINDRVRLAETPSLSLQGELSGLQAKEVERLRLRSSYHALQRQLIAQLHRREGLPDPAPDMVFEVEREGRAIAEAVSDGTIRFWDLHHKAARSTLYRGLAGPIATLGVNTHFGALAAVNESGRLAVWQIGVPAAPRFVRALAPALAGARPLSAVRTAADTTVSSESFSSAPAIRFLGDSRWLYIDFDYFLDVGSSTGLAWRLPAGAHEGAVLEDCCAMKLFEDRFDLWRVGPGTDRPERMAPQRPVPDVTAYDYKAGSHRLALGLLNGQVLVMELDAAGSVMKSAIITSHDFAISALALSSDARIVVAGSISGITLTELADDLSVVRHVRLTGHRNDVHVLRFSPGDTWLLSGGEDNSVHVHPVNANQVVNLACLVAGRPLSSVEKGRLGDTRVPNVCEAKSQEP